MEFNTKVFQIKTLTRSLITIVCICFFAAPAFAQYDLSGAVSVRNQKQTVSTMLYGGTNNASMFRTQEDLDKYPHTKSQNLGDFILQDKDGDGQITSNDRYRSPYNTIPQIVYGITFEGKWKDFDFMVLLQGQGRARLDLGVNNDPAVGNILKSVYEDSYSLTNTTASKPKLRASYSGDYYLRKANFIRLKNVEVGYNFHGDFFSKIGISNLRFYIGGYNLLTISPLKEIDPETNSTDLQAYPQVRVFNTGVKVTF